MEVVDEPAAKTEEMNREESELKLRNSGTISVLNSPKYSRKVSHYCGFRKKMISGNIIIKYKFKSISYIMQAAY